MKPAPPVTRTRFTGADRTRAGRTRPALQLALDRVQRPPLDLPLYPHEVLPYEREHEALHAEHEEDGRPEEERPREVGLADPEGDPVDAEDGGRERADEAEHDAGPLDRLRPEAGEHVQRQPGQAE